MSDSKTVFMVDDDVTICELVGNFIESKGFSFKSMNRMEGALEAIQKMKPDLILLDLHLPDGSGLHLCKDIKGQEKLEHIPIFMLTTREFNIEKEMALQAGASVFIQKPFDFELFGEQVEEALLPTVDIKFWGVRGSTPCANREHMKYGGNTSCMQIVVPGSEEFLIFDAGSGIRNLGNNMIEHGKGIKGRIFITHAHWDHIQGFPFFKPFYIPENHFTIHLPQQLVGGSKDVLSGQMTYTYFPVTPEMLMASLEYQTQTYHLQDYDGYQVEFMLANHPVATAIYKIHTCGRVIIYCPDNELIPGKEGQKIPFRDHLLEFIKDADFVIHDGQYTHETYGPRRNWGHSAWEEAAELCAEAGVKNLFITHHDPDSTDAILSKVDSDLDKYRSKFDTLQLAREGQVFKLSAVAKVTQ